MDIKIQVQVIVASILCFGLLMVALYILLIGPIREIFTDETVFTETYQKINDTGKSFSEALILASTNPQYDQRLFIQLQVQNMSRTYVHKLF